MKKTNPGSRRMPMLVGALLAFSTILTAATERTLYSFNPWPISGIPSGVQPDGTLLRGADGSLYGAAMLGGTYYNGTIFKLSPPAAGQTEWNYSVLYSFSGGPDGGSPNADLIMDSSGALYGTARTGGSWTSQGVVFKLSPPAPGATQWNYRVIHTFYFYAWGNLDGANPAAGLVMDASGALYGTTHLGGTAGDIYGKGIVFKLTPLDTARTNWQESIIYRFAGGADGQAPMAALTLDNAGNLFGTTFGGGAGTCGGAGCGTVFKLSPPASGASTWTKTTLLTFNGTNGGKPEAKLLRDASGALFGTTYQGGNGPCKDTNYWPPTVIGCGTIFKLSPPAAGQTSWNHSILLHFDGANGAFPEGGVIADTAGNLFGATSKSNTDIWGLGGYGFAYKLVPPAAGQTAWTPVLLHKFDLMTSGGQAVGELVRGPNGRLYGVAYGGGRYYGGTVYEIDPEAAAPVVIQEDDGGSGGSIAPLGGRVSGGGDISR